MLGWENEDIRHTFTLSVPHILRTITEIFMF